MFFHSSEDRERAATALQAQFPGLSVSAEDVPDEDWAARSQASLKAIRVGDVVIAPPWDVPVRLKPDTTYDDAATGVVSGFSRTVIIQPSMGFGTGHHATTRLCLAALQRLDVKGCSVLDVGTGSGVLAIAASLLGASPVTGIDDDPDAMQAARENAALNPGARVDLRVADLREMPPGSFGLVLGNLTGGLLVQSAARLRGLVAAPGRLVLSGFMTHEEDDVRAAYADLAIEARAEEDEWVCVTLHRS